MISQSQEQKMWAVLTLCSTVLGVVLWTILSVYKIDNDVKTNAYVIGVFEGFFITLTPITGYYVYRSMFRIPVTVATEITRIIQNQNETPPV